MANTGLHQRLIPYISDYARWRRCLVTNPTLNLSAAKKHFKAWLPYKDIPVRINKNCPICAAHFFHAAAYEWPWVKVCPLHHEPLVTVCPQCQRPWPRKDELRMRDCSSCGAKVPFKALDMEGFFLPTTDMGGIKVVHELLNLFEIYHGAMLLAEMDTPWHCCMQHSISFGDPLMPAILSVHSKALRRSLHIARIALPRVYIFTADNLATVPNEARSFSTAAARAIEHELIAQVRRRLFRYIAFSLKNEEFHDSVVHFDQGRVTRDTNIYFLAYCIWQDLMAKRHVGYKHWYDFEFGHLYKDAADGQIPLIPSLKPTLAVGYPFCIGRNPHRLLEHRSLRLPDRLIRLVYELELRRLFFCILQFLGALKRGLNDETHGPQAYLDSAVYQGWEPQISCSLPMGIFKHGPRGLRLIIPRQCFEDPPKHFDLDVCYKHDALNLDYKRYSADRYHGRHIIPQGELERIWRELSYSGKKG